MRINFCSAPCGSGKTYQIINRACEIVRSHNRVLVLQPTKELIERTVREEVLSRANPPPVQVFHRGTVSNGKVSKALADYIRQPPDVPEIVLATHQVLPHVKHFANKGDWHVVVDEEPQAIRYAQHRVPQTHRLITDHLDVNPVNAIYGRVMIGDVRAVLEIAKNPDDDEIFETLAGTSRILANPHWNTFVNLEQYDRLKRGKGKVLAFHSVLKPEILAGFADVFMASANFEDSAIFQLWTEQGVRFEPDHEFGQGLRCLAHPNGHLMTIYYVTDRQWSKKRREALAGEDGVTVQDRLIQAAKELFPSGRFVWQANKSLADDPFGPSAKRLPNKPHGLNSFSTFDDIVFLSSLNPTTDHFRFLESRGLSGGRVRTFTYYAQAYQACLRTSLRDPTNRTPKRILVPDHGLAGYLHDVFPGSRLEKLDIGLKDEPTKKRGRPRKHGSNKERLAQQRQKAREREAALWAKQIRLNSPDAVGEGNCGGSGGGSQAENSIRLFYTNFSTGPRAGSIFTSIASPIPFAYVSGEIDFIRFLNDCHYRKIKSKDNNYLFSPAIFDPYKASGTSRATANIAYLRNVVQDFEGGVLKPDEVANLFPGLRMVVTNSFRHTSDRPRFRVVFPTNENMTPEIYGLIQGCLVDKLEEAGYFVERGAKRKKGTRSSGLDWSKSLPTSLFYLPCQAQESGDSFFQDYRDDGREPLQPSIWLQNITVPLQPGLEFLHQPEIHGEGVDEVAIQRAKDEWHKSKGRPGSGDMMFFDLALALRRAGMNLPEIETTLRGEAQFGRSPKERLTQIPSIMNSLRRYFGLVS